MSRRWRESLRRSRTRKDILLFLRNTFPEASSPSEIAQAVGHSATDVLGALTGMRKRYLSNRSLVALGLVEVLMENDRKLYRISQAGKRFAENNMMKEHT